MLLVETTPPSNRALPFVRNLREDVEARANVGAPFGIVRRGAEEVCRPVLGTMRVRVVQSRDGIVERTVGRAADFIPGQQRYIDVERGVFDTFGRRRASQLLESAHKSRARRLIDWRCRS